MVDYQALYSFLVGRVDEALTLLDTESPLVYRDVRELLSGALLEAEERAIEGMGEECKIICISKTENS